MPREWHSLRFFVREDGRPRPTILFWLFFVPGLAVVVAGCYLILGRRGDQAAVTSALTGTPAPQTPISIPTETLTPAPSTDVPEATEFIYDDPSDWEFIERTDPTGKTYLDLQDWQKAQVWHAFEKFWNLFNHNAEGLPDWSELEPYVGGSFVDFVRGDHEAALETGQYVYLVEGLVDIPHRAMVLESAEEGDVRVKIVLVMDRSYQVQYRDVQTGAVLEEGKWLPYATWNFLMAYQDNRWVVEEESHDLFEE